jgi:hypothetical protein
MHDSFAGGRVPLINTSTVCRLPKKTLQPQHLQTALTSAALSLGPLPVCARCRSVRLPSFVGGAGSLSQLGPLGELGESYVPSPLQLRQPSRGLPGAGDGGKGAQARGIKGGRLLPQAWIRPRGRLLGGIVAAGSDFLYIPPLADCIPPSCSLNGHPYGPARPTTFVFKGFSRVFQGFFKGC